MEIDEGTKTVLAVGDDGKLPRKLRPAQNLGRGMG
jgi:hypothetical protein